MIKRYRASCLAVLLVSLLVHRMTGAQGFQEAGNGCALLAVLIRAELGAAIGHRNSYSDVPILQQDGLSICQRTTATVTAAFTASVRQRNIFVSWGMLVGGSGGYCPGHYLSQCFPTQSPNMPKPDAVDNALVLTAWRSVRRVVNATLQPASGSDVSRFEYSVLRNELRRSLASVHLNRSGAGSVPAY